MMEGLWSDILERFGEDVILRKNEVDIPARALVQPCLELRKGQELPGPLGLERQERFRYLGPAGRPLDLDTVVVWRDRDYRVRWAQLTGEGVCPHWWAVLCPREEEVL
ncbi:hypothetical protein D1641_11315 [Colidextribacter sp. OB.20]|uniref:hypothetical protein n=1 Tax=Colidextribacter sp. OB.20 TaxID=2304568 RepID=UPI00136D6687|nr:hypothetical protein [Colidextribacter sp. OB.20]NBI10595.1 hypothetical protein [Colidextribacter sp. OB.20]